MTETDLHSTTECTSTTDSVAERSVWVRALYKVGLVYLFSRACVVVGAGIVAAELRADQNKIDSDLPTAVGPRMRNV